MRKIQNFFSYFRASDLPTNQIFELFDSSNKGKDISPYKIEYSFSKDILSECELEELLSHLIIALRLPQFQEAKPFELLLKMKQKHELA